MSPKAQRETYWRHLLDVLAQMITDPLPENDPWQQMRRRLGRRYARLWLEACKAERTAQ